MKKRVADIIMDILCENGIEDCFSVVGGGAMHLNNAMARCDKLNKYFNHHEQACAMAAEAYARYSGKMCAVCVTSGPGGTNALTGVMGAWQDSLPMVIISGQVRYETTIEYSGLSLRHRGLQEFNIIESVKNMTKYVVMLKNPLEVKRELIKAIKIAMNGRRGPVWIDVPLDIQSALVEESELYGLEEQVTSDCINDEELLEVIKLISNAKSPCILAGSGVISSGCRELFHDFVDHNNIPIVGGAWVCDTDAMSTKRYYGISGNIGPRTGNFIIQNADIILVLGNSLAYRQTGFAQELFAPDAEIVMIDIDENEHKKPGLHISKFIKSGLYEFLVKWLRKGLSVSAPQEWIDYCDMIKDRFSPFEAIKDVDQENKVCSYYFWKLFSRYANSDTILALGNNTANTAKLQIGIQERKQRTLTNYTCGSMGYDLPAAIGAAVSSGKEVICSTGDGSIMMNIQELQTIKQYNLPIKVIIFSNNGYNAIRQTCKNFFNSEYIGCTKESGVSFPDFSRIAVAFDYEYNCCHKNGDIDECLKWLFTSKTQAILEVNQQLDDPVIPKVTSKLNDDGTFSTPAIHDMAPFLKADELESLMYKGDK